MAMKYNLGKLLKPRWFVGGVALGIRLINSMFFPQSKAKTTEIWNKEDGK